MTTTRIALEIINDVHIFTFKDSSRRACKEYVALAGIKLREWIEKYGRRPFPVILDISKSGLFSVSYVKELTKKNFEGLPFLPEIHLAYLTDSGQDIMIIGTLDPIARNQVNNTRRVFSPKDIDEAINWLQGAATA